MDIKRLKLSPTDSSSSEGLRKTYRDLTVLRLPDCKDSDLERATLVYKSVKSAFLGSK